MAGTGIMDMATPPRFVRGVITTITRTPVRRMAITALAGLLAGSLSAPAPGITVIGDAAMDTVAVDTMAGPATDMVAAAMATVVVA